MPKKSVRFYDICKYAENILLFLPPKTGTFWGGVALKSGYKR